MDETQTNQEQVECEVNDMEEYHMSDMDEQETLINESNSMEYENTSAGKLRNLRIFQGNNSGESTGDVGKRSNVSNSSLLKDSVIHQPKEFPKINPSGSITDNKSSRSFTQLAELAATMQR